MRLRSLADFSIQIRFCGMPQNRTSLNRDVTPNFFLIEDTLFLQTENAEPLLSQQKNSCLTNFASCVQCRKKLSLSILRMGRWCNNELKGSISTPYSRSFHPNSSTSSENPLKKRVFEGFRISFNSHVKFNKIWVPKKRK